MVFGFFKKTWFLPTLQLGHEDNEEEHHNPPQLGHEHNEDDEEEHDNAEHLHHQPPVRGDRFEVL